MQYAGMTKQTLLELTRQRRQAVSVHHRQEAGSEVNNSEAVRVPGEEQLTLKQQLHSLRTRMEAAIQLNSGLDLQLRLAPDELILNAPLRYHPFCPQCVAGINSICSL